MALSRVDAVILNPRSGGGRARTRWRELLSASAARDFGLHETRVFDGPVLNWLKRTSTDGAILYAALSTFGRFHDLPLRLSWDGGPWEALSLTNLGIIKGRYFSGTFRYDFGPTAADGKLGLLSCEKMSRGRILRTLASLGSGKFVGLPGTTARLVEVVRVESTLARDFAVETDGEVHQASRVDFRVVPHHHKATC